MHRQHRWWWQHHSCQQGQLWSTDPLKKGCNVRGYSIFSCGEVAYPSVFGSSSDHSIRIWTSATMMMITFHSHNNQGDLTLDTSQGNKKKQVSYLCISTRWCAPSYKWIIIPMNYIDISPIYYRLMFTNLANYGAPPFTCLYKCLHALAAHQPPCIWTFPRQGSSAVPGRSCARRAHSSLGFDLRFCAAGGRAEVSQRGCNQKGLGKSPH